VTSWQAEAAFAGSDRTVLLIFRNRRNGYRSCEMSEILAIYGHFSSALSLSTLFYTVFSTLFSR